MQGQRRGLGFRLEEGQSVLVLGSINVYERDGKYQLYASQINLDGQGALYERFEKLKKDLHAQGLFDKAIKSLFLFIQVVWALLPLLQGQQSRI